MKKTIFYSLLCLFFTTFSLVSCSDDDDPKEEEIEALLSMDFGVDHGTVTYNDNTILYFTEKGKKQRIEDKDENGNITAVMLLDRAAKKCYILAPETKTYITLTDEASTSANPFIFLGDDIGYTAAAAGATKSEKTIAGKKCTVWKWTENNNSYEYGGYKRIVMLSKDKDDSFEAISFSESAPSVSFTVPSDYISTAIPNM
ncbi:hypothetical protein AALK14_19850 [Butyricimonas hominis]|uniref:hypothetical protein n=1 Tax=Butyricimonas TaxID=574697 RepID=UPI003517802A